MQGNCFTLNDVIKNFRNEAIQAERQALATVPFTNETLIECSRTHILFPGFPLTILDLRERAPGVVPFTKKGITLSQNFLFNCNVLRLRPLEHRELTPTTPVL